MTEAARTSPATLHDVAREAGVSLATASRSLNGSTRKVNGDYRDRVLEAAQRLGYTPNLSAQAVARGATSTVALVVSDIADPYFSSIAAGVIRGAEEERLLVTMAVTERRAERELELVRTLRGQRPRVLILSGSRFVGADLEESLIKELTAFEETGGRVVIVSQNELPFDTVQINNHKGAKDLASALVAQGYRRFAAITGISSLMTSRDRLSGFLEGLNEHGLTIADEHRAHADFTREGGYEAASKLIEGGLDDIDMIFAVNDVMAIGALSRLREAGIQVPQSVGVAGFDDISTARDVTPALSTVQLPLERVGAAALELALKPRTSSERAIVTIDGTVVVRESTPQRS